jgi:hypothetical protein
MLGEEGACLSGALALLCTLVLLLLHRVHLLLGAGLVDEVLQVRTAGTPRLIQLSACALRLRGAF